MKFMRIKKITVIGVGLAAMMMVQGCGRGNAPVAGATRTVDLGGGVSMELVWIPPGTFMMGSTPEEREWAAGPEGKGEARWYTDEGDSPRRVEIAQGFWMGQTTVTRGMFRRFVEEENYRTEAERDGRAFAYDPQTGFWDVLDGKSWRDPGFEQTDAHPVVCITWNDAMAFCDWLTRIELEAGRLPAGYEYRLPGEAEWEYAARGGERERTMFWLSGEAEWEYAAHGGERERTMFWWGDSLADGRGSFNAAGTDRLPDGSRWTQGYDWEDGFAFTSPVDHYGARGRNGFGLADMLGNVWEWCYDGYDAKAAHATIWQEDTSRRVLRGGSFDSQPGYLRCAYRGRTHPANPNAVSGFRVVLAPRVVCR